MAVLNDAGNKIRKLLAEIERTQQSYEVARHAYEAASTPELAPPDLSGIGMMLTVGEYNLPVPLPADLTKLSEHLASSINFLAAQLAALWRELHVTSGAAVQYVDEAFANSQDDQPGVESPPPIAPFPQVPAVVQPPMQPPQRTGVPASVTLPPGTRIPTTPVQ